MINAIFFYPLNMIYWAWNLVDWTIKMFKGEISLKEFFDDIPF